MNFEEKNKQLLFDQLQLLHFSLDAIQCKFTKNIENLQKIALRFLCNDYEISYEELLSESATSSMHVRRLRALCVELYKTINKLNPNFMRDFSKLSVTNRHVREIYKMNMIIPEFNQVSYGKKSLKTFRPKLWNNVSQHIKSS